MPRIARLCAEGYPHHITQRGNNKETVFFDDEDRRFYLDALERYKNKYGIRILAYCLMGTIFIFLQCLKEKHHWPEAWEEQTFSIRNT